MVGTSGLELLALAKTKTVVELVELVETAPREDVQELWDQAGIDERRDDKDWYLPYDVQIACLARLWPRDYAEPERAPRPTLIVERTLKVRVLSSRRSAGPQDTAKDRANGLLGFRLWDPGDLPTLPEGLMRCFTRRANSTVVAGKIRVDGARR
ncbi:MAG: hypothetical protein IAF94_08630 [Pirellulaceae bacterium]|nr:hypothetical protein [Pirellulaceae bacterium]